MHCIDCKKDFTTKGWFERHMKLHQESVAKKRKLKKHKKRKSFGDKCKICEHLLQIIQPIKNSHDNQKLTKRCILNT
jgi:hypothetical protein